MGDKVQIFEHEEFGKVRVVMIDGEPWFVAADVCRILKLADTHVALRKLDDDEKGRCLIPTLGGEQQMSIVNEPGLYRLIFTSRVDGAKKFQRWVYHEVLPSIRKTGSYFTAGNNRFDSPVAFERGKELKRLSSHTRDPITREKLVVEAANLIAGREFVSDNPFYEPEFFYSSKTRSGR